MNKEPIILTDENENAVDSPPVTEEERAAFLKELRDWQRKHPNLRPGQKKIRNRMSHLTPKKKKRK